MGCKITYIRQDAPRGIAHAIGIAEDFVNGDYTRNTKNDRSRELYNDMKTGYIAEYKNPGDLANGVELFLRDDELRDKAGILAREKVGDKFTRNQQVDNYLKLYSQILDKKRGLNK